MWKVKIVYESNSDGSKIVMTFYLFRDNDPFKFQTLLFKRGHWWFKLSIILRRTCRCNLNSGFQSLAGFRIPNAEFRIQRAGKTCDLFCCKTS